MCKNVLPAYSGAKIIKVKGVFPKLWSEMYCHIFMKQCVMGSWHISSHCHATKACAVVWLKLPHWQSCKIMPELTKAVLQVPQCIVLSCCVHLSSGIWRDMPLLCLLAESCCVCRHSIWTWSLLRLSLYSQYSCLLLLSCSIQSEHLSSTDDVCSGCWTCLLTENLNVQLFLKQT